MSQAASVIEELEYVLAAGSSDRRTEILRRMTDLFSATQAISTPNRLAFSTTCSPTSSGRSRPRRLRSLVRNSHPSTMRPTRSSAASPVTMRSRSPVRSGPLGPTHGRRPDGDRRRERPRSPGRDLRTNASCSGRHRHPDPARRHRDGPQVVAKSGRDFPIAVM
jgi:hypothetical protein